MTSNKEDIMFAKSMYHDSDIMHQAPNAHAFYKTEQEVIKG